MGCSRGAGARPAELARSRRVTDGGADAARSLSACRVRGSGRARWRRQGGHGRTSEHTCALASGEPRAQSCRSWRGVGLGTDPGSGPEGPCRPTGLSAGAAGPRAGGCRGREPDVPVGPRPRPGRAHGLGRRGIILGNPATKLLVPAACFLPQKRLEQEEKHRASETLGEALTVNQPAGRVGRPDTGTAGARALGRGRGPHPGAQGLLPRRP